MGLAEVVDRGPADIHCSEVLLHPLHDLLPSSRVPVEAASVITAYEVPHLMVSDVLLELREGRRVVPTAESADRHDRFARLQFEAAHPHRPDTRRGPAAVD